MLQLPESGAAAPLLGCSASDLGVDSLMAVEIRVWTYKAAGILAPPSIARLCANAAGVVVAGRKEGAVAAAESKKQAAAVVSHNDQGIATAVAATANSPQVSASGSTISKDGVASVNTIT
ncbi:hypothetical protein GGTG_14336 [Gaeumannomyces tritici R3-111a-1]|uniref:Carrier domain-containing protein n=1 Tax=Gaeumannomyces tritici (strain R3-111a-1) TaxID=644352 RepID=J3PL87_GAET3|nr:hypothetical protein GGTG_14336 [Gaeumannomyces tritici R3-111a-1]EJT68084.1 hypothetical protein GGTG_14336 [Gaeumannomyces tritici R3-111a-1]